MRYIMNHLESIDSTAMETTNLKKKIGLVILIVLLVAFYTLSFYFLLNS